MSGTRSAGWQALPIRSARVDRALMNEDARRAFVLENTRVHPVPHAPEIRLHLADEAVALWQRTEDELQQQGIAPPFWAFAWAGGQGLARYVLDHPAEFAGRCLIDFAGGSGVAGVAAALAGARATCIDIDPFAATVAVMNAQVNGVAIEARTRDVVGHSAERLGRPDVICAGDVHYDRAMAEPVTAWLRSLRAEGVRVLVGDPGRSYFPRDLGWKELSRYDVPVIRDLEDREIRSVGVFEVTAP